MYPVACCPKSNTRGGAPAWTPLSLTSPLIWCDATQQAEGNGDPVAQFTNLVPSGPHFAESTAANKPTLLSSGINGLASLRGDGVDDNLSLTGLGAQAAWSAAIVFRQHTADTGENTFWSIADYPSAAAYKMLEKAAGADGVSGIYINGNPGFTGTLPTYSAGTVEAIIVTGNAAGGVIRDGLGNSATNVNNQSRADDLMRLFRRGDGNYAPADIGEIIFTGAVMTAEEIATVFSYFGTKWGTPVP